MLEQYPDAAIAYRTSTWIDIEGNTLEKESARYHTIGLDPMLRLFFPIWGNAHPIVVIVRARYLLEIPRIFTCIGADQTLFTDIVLRGEFMHLWRTSWRPRQPSQQEDYDVKLKCYTRKEFGMAGSSIDGKLSRLRLPFEQTQSVLRSEIGWLRKVSVLLALFPAFLVRYIAGRTQ